ncbi:putative prolyl 4-hydroxylase 12 isoform X1 [Senna tora]|uniref:procollagen-proline 4-dioxygenase n=1 Tax=Senna tora TaxID=362788 RepID=A0A834W7I4_9FABA|nr:putative prolyl 4-hydroxylase 12 isoform X1 [Senna tora]
MLLLILQCFLSVAVYFSSRKELRNKELSQKNVLQLDHSIHPNRIDPSRVLQLSWRPRVFLYQGFLSDKECDYLISLAQTVKEKSSGKDHHAEGDEANGKLTSETLLNIDDDIVAKIEERISVWTFLPKENSKPIQVMHYANEKAEQNAQLFNKSKLESSGPLMATVVLYLSNVTQGGQIIFPESEPKSVSWSDCGKSDNILKPVKGNAVLFFSLHHNTSPDKSSFHARCPVLEGEMWFGTKFFYARPVSTEKVSSISDGGDDECTDMDDNCASWAAMGECQRNPVYMIGSPDYYGTCRKSCKAC